MTATATRDLPHLAAERRPSAPVARIALIGLVNFTLYLALLTPVIVTLALRVAALDPAHKERSLGLVTGVGAVVALLANPLAGRLADRTRSRYGRRRPWLVGGAFGGLAGLLVIATAPDVVLVAVGWCITQAAYNACLSALQSTVREQIPDTFRGRVSGVMGLTRTAGIIAGSVLAAVFAGRPLGQFLVPPVLLLGAVALLVARFGERAPDTRPVPLSARELAGSFLINPRRHPNLGWFWAARFCMVLGGVVPLTYLVYYLPDRLGVPAGQVPGVVAIFTGVGAGTTVLVAAATGWVADRFAGQRRFIVLACLINASALVVFASAGSPAVALAAEAAVGVGNGLYFAVDMAVLSRVLPDPETVGKDLGVMNIASTLPQTITPALAPMVLALGGYNLLYLLGAAAMVAAASLVGRVRLARTPAFV